MMKRNEKVEVYRLGGVTAIVAERQPALRPGEVWMNRWAADAFVLQYMEKHKSRLVKVEEEAVMSDAALAAHDAEVAAKALEEFADQMTTGFNRETLNAERRAIKREARARAAECRKAVQ